MTFQRGTIGLHLPSQTLFVAERGDKSFLYPSATSNAGYKRSECRVAAHGDLMGDRPFQIRVGNRLVSVQYFADEQYFRLGSGVGEKRLMVRLPNADMSQAVESFARFFDGVIVDEALPEVAIAQYRDKEK